jgi:predicted enzyme related to lactoylglutathione lyase
MKGELMPEMNEYSSGTFCWIDLGTTDASGAKRFYGELFGWGFNDQPAGPDIVYTMLQIAGKDVAALYELDEEMQSQGIPPSWLSYVSVSSADDTAQKAKELGGRVIKEAFDVFDVGRMAIVQDPLGATFALWQPRSHIGARLINQPATLCWNELMTTDVDKAERFYTELFGWKSEVQQMGPTTYTTFQNGERPAAGMLAISKEMGEIPPNWMVYFAVDDCEKSVDKAKSLGGKIDAPTTEIRGVGRFAVVQDPQGAHFAFIQLENPSS